jgi:hypothetical protein
VQEDFMEINLVARRGGSAQAAAPHLCGHGADHEARGLSVARSGLLSLSQNFHSSF